MLKLSYDVTMFLLEKVLLCNMYYTQKHKNTGIHKNIKCLKLKKIIIKLSAELSKVYNIMMVESFH